MPELARLLPWPGGIRRSATLSATGATNLLPTLLAAPMAQGTWAVVVGVPQLCALPTSEYGIDLSRLTMVPHPSERCAEVVAPGHERGDPT
ncbi:hypothetical protein [Micromonospora yangpuensis]|uniref:hypothetical protein n=1 Tax=Micromonospora yangpuensis TaxID=683228 RepID=UPI001112ED84|nr:hypothetical protein [Micromonospora yangpuensis]